MPQDDDDDAIEAVMDAMREPLVGLARLHGAGQAGRDRLEPTAPRNQDDDAGALIAQRVRDFFRGVDARKNNPEVIRREAYEREQFEHSGAIAAMVRCPSCGAVAGSPCVRPSEARPVGWSRSPAGDHHDDRLTLAYEPRNAEPLLHEIDPKTLPALVHGLNERYGGVEHALAIAKLRPSTVGADAEPVGPDEDAGDAQAERGDALQVFSAAPRFTVQLSMEQWIAQPELLLAAEAVPLLLGEDPREAWGRDRHGPIRFGTWYLRAKEAGDEECVRALELLAAACSDGRIRMRNAPDGTWITPDEAIVGWHALGFPVPTGLAEAWVRGREALPLAGVLFDRRVAATLEILRLELSAARGKGPAREQGPRQRGQSGPIPGQRGSDARRPAASALERAGLASVSSKTDADTDRARAANFVRVVHRLNARGLAEPKAIAAAELLAAAYALPVLDGATRDHVREPPYTESPADTPIARDDANDMVGASEGRAGETGNDVPDRSPLTGAVQRSAPGRAGRPASTDTAAMRAAFDAMVARGDDPGRGEAAVHAVHEEAQRRAEAGAGAHVELTPALITRITGYLKPSGPWRRR